MAGCVHRTVGLLLAVVGVGILAGGSSILGGIMLVVGTLFLFEGFRRRKVLRTPEQVTAYIIEHFGDVTEKEIASASMEIMKAKPYSPERDLLYALRVSKCVPMLKSLKTLASRWGTANFGAGGTGLQGGEQSPNWRRTHEFLSGLYVRRFDELCAEAVQKATEMAAKRKTDKAKKNAFAQAVERIDLATTEFTYELPGLNEAVDRWLKELDVRSQATGDDPGSGD